jgi:hypothetical protein
MIIRACLFRQEVEGLLQLAGYHPSVSKERGNLKPE